MCKQSVGAGLPAMAAPHHPIPPRIRAPFICIPSPLLKNRLQPPYVFPSGIFAPLRGDSPLTTIVSVRRHGKVVMAGDGQVSLGNTVMKGNAKKVRRLYHGQVIAGFAGATADAFTLFERFEGQLEKHQGHLVRAAVELAKEWRTDRSLSRLEAMLAVANKDASLIITGNGDVVEPEDGLIAMGSGGAFAQAAARALLMKTDLSAREIAETALGIAGDICVFTNHNITIEEQDLAE